MKTAKAYAEPSYLEMSFSGLEFHSDGDKLTIRVPSRNLSGPLVSQDVRQEMMDSGLTALEVDFMIDDWYDQFISKSFAAYLMKHRTK